MFYRESYNCIMYKDNPELIEAFDYLIGSLLREQAKWITVTYVSEKLQIPFEISKQLLCLYENEGILEKWYSIVCPICGQVLETVKEEEISETLEELSYCVECESEEVKCTNDNIYIIFRRIKTPTVSQTEINETLIKNQDLTVISENDKYFFSDADLLVKNIKELYKQFYNPDESAYQTLKQMRASLDNDFGRNKTAKGAAYEELVLTLFRHVKTLKGTNKIRTKTNQFDCTVLSPVTTYYLSIFQKLTPYFTIECKNEKRTPSNTYFHKLSDILATNDAQLGIVFSRKPPGKESMAIAHDQFLLNKNSLRQRYLIGLSDKDLEAIIDKRINLLEYLDYKILEMTTNARNATYEMFLQHITK